MVGVYKDPEGKDIFSRSGMSPTDGLGMSTKDANDTDTLRKRIKDLEKELEEKVMHVHVHAVESTESLFSVGPKTH